MSTAIAKVEQVSPMALLQHAVSQGAGIDTIERLAKLQREMLDYDARVGFEQAMHAAQSEMRRIGADAVNPQTRSKYTTFAKMDGALRPIYTRHGLSVSFNTADCPLTDHVRLIAYVSREGYTREYQIDIPSDGKGAKGGDVMTKTHATGAAMSYGSRYLLKAIFNVAVGEDDDDGNDAKKMPEDKLAEWLDEIEACYDADQLKKQYLAAAAAADAFGDKLAVRVLADAKNKKWRAMHPKVAA